MISIPSSKTFFAVWIHITRRYNPDIWKAYLKHITTHYSAKRYSQGFQIKTVNLPHVSSGLSHPGYWSLPIKTAWSALMLSRKSVTSYKRKVIAHFPFQPYESYRALSLLQKRGTEQSRAVNTLLLLHSRNLPNH